MQSVIKTFNNLTINELHDIYQLRVAVFVVEQTCCYHEVDGLDTHPETRHLMYWDDTTLAGYTRILAPDTSYPGYSSIGRIANTMNHRGMGLGQQMVQRSVEACLQYWPDKSIKIGAQAHLQEFYGQFQFKTVTDEYLDDGIPHVGMIRETRASA